MGATRLAVSCAALVAMSLAACTSSGTKPQSGPSATSAINSPSPSVTASSATPSPADAAIKTYVEFVTLYSNSTRDPAKTDLTKLDSYVTGSATTIFRDSIINMAVAGLAYRGTLPDLRVKVGEIRSPSDVVLTSCPKDSPTDPFVQYTQANGQPVPTPSATTPGYQRTIHMIESGGSWLISEFRTDSGVTCEG